MRICSTGFQYMCPGEDIDVLLGEEKGTGDTSNCIDIKMGDALAAEYHKGLQLPVVK